MPSTINYTPSAGSKLEYSTDSGTTWNQIIGLVSIPAIGAAPNQIDTTSLDNMVYETFVYGLMPAPQLEFPFHMEDPSATANINTVLSLVGQPAMQWKITKSNGITHTYSSVVKVSYDELGVDEIANFTMYNAPIGEIITVAPTA